MNKATSTFHNNKITRQLLVVNGLICIAFVVITVVVLFSFRDIEGMLTTVFQKETTRIIENSRLGRDLVRVLSETNNVVGTFYGNEEILTTTGNELVSKTVNLIAESTDNELNALLVSFKQTLEEVFEQCAVVNQTRREIEEIDHSLISTLNTLDNVISEQLIELTLQGEDVSGIEQISSLLPGFRESVLTIRSQFAQLGLEYFEAPLEEQEHPLLTLLESLQLRFRALPTSEPGIAEHAQNLIKGVTTYQEAVVRFHQVAAELRIRLGTMNRKTEDLLTVMGERDRQIEQTTEDALATMKTRIFRSTLICLAVFLAILPVVMVGVFTARSITRPIRQIITYINRLSRGDIPNKITATYKGEFNELKKNLNILIDAMNETTHLAEEISIGNLKVDVKERSEHDRLMKALNRMIWRLNAILEETDGLSQAVQDGRLDIRGNADAFAGSWQELVIGINNVIDAFVAPIMMAAGYIDRIAKGDIPDKISETYNGDFNEIKENLNTLIAAMNAITRLAEEMAEGNLLVKVQERSEQDTLMRALNAMSQQLEDVVLHVKAAADNVATSSEELSSSAEMMSQGASQQASAAEEVSSSMQEMAANIRQNADNARQTEQIALQSARYAEEGSNVIGETVMVMQEIAQKITIIKEISDQTRMLSLNATIEAARAQEHGKAFSVVAAEVRKLSDVTKKAAEQIDQLATSSLDVSKKAGHMLETLVPSIHKTSELIQEISAASNEQSTSTEHVNTAIQQLDQVTQQNAASADEIASTAGTLAMQANQLQQTIAFFKIGEAVSQSTRTTKPLREPIPLEPSPEDVAEKAHSNIEKDNGQRDETSFGYPFDLDQQEKDEDERDAEFERY